MSCSLCWAISESRKKKSYLIHLIDKQTNRLGRCVFQSECLHGMQEWAEELASVESLMVVDPDTDEKFQMNHPLVVHVDPNAAAHLLIIEPDPVN